MTIVECTTPDQTFALGQAVGGKLDAGHVVLLTGGLGAGKTLFAKGILDALGYDIDEVSSPSFTLVNLYRTDEFDVYHIDLWRLAGTENTAEAVGLDEILESGEAIVIIEWADRLGNIAWTQPLVDVNIRGEGDEPRTVRIKAANQPENLT